MDFFYTLIATVLVFIRDQLGPLLGPDSGLTWALAIVILSLALRLVLLPFNIRQFHAQRSMQSAQPALRELSKRFREETKKLQDAPLRPEERTARLKELKLRQVSETRALNKDHNVRFGALFLPIIVQIAVGIGLFTVIREFQPGTSPRYGIDADTLASGAGANVFGAPLAARLLSSNAEIIGLGGAPGAAHFGALVLVLLAAGLSALGFRQAFKRTPPPDLTPPKSAEEQVQYQMNLMQDLMRRRGPVFLPLVLLATYAFLPIGLLLNIAVITAWTAVYQRIMYARHPYAAAPSSVLTTAVVPVEDSAPPRQRTQPKRSSSRRKRRR